MCFRVVFDKTVIGQLSPFRNMADRSWPEGELSAFSFPSLPIIASGREEAFSAGWGLIPPWVRDKEQAKKLRSATVNARSETVHQKPSFRSSWPEKRCILPVRGFFEPHLAETGKETWLIERADGGFFFLGGLYAETSSLLRGDFPERTFSLITLEARDFLAEVHNEKKRMPLLMTGEKALEWIGAEKSVIDLFHPSWQLDQRELSGKCINKENKKSDILKETSLFSIFN